LGGLVKKVEQILFNFTRQELGNRSSEFSTLALKEIILNEIKNYKPIKGEVVNNVKKQNMVRDNLIGYLPNI